MLDLSVVQKIWCGVDTEMWKEDETTECSALSVGFTTETRIVLTVVVLSLQH